MEQRDGLASTSMEHVELVRVPPPRVAMNHLQTHQHLY